MKRNLLITYDYELFLGNRSGKAIDCILKPTRRLLAIMAETSVKAIFFIDSVFLMRLKKQAETHEACKFDWLEISQQIGEMITKGHYVYPHIHPHWLDAFYLEDENEWKLDNIDRYRFANISEEARHLVFSESIAILKDIIHQVKPDYELDAHRAGGWSIQPFADFLPYYKKFGIKYDFSVLDKAYMFTKAQYFDFSTIPNKDIYRFNDDVTMEVPDGDFIEIVNSTHQLNPIIKFLDRILLKILYKVAHDYSYGKGSGQMAIKMETILPKSYKGLNMTNSDNQYISVEQLSIIKITGYLLFLKRNKLMHFVSHPKMVTNHNLKSFRRFLKIAHRRYVIESDFKKMI